MIRQKSDIIVASLLLFFCAIMIKASFDIRDLGFQGLGPETWPRALLIILSGLSAIYLVTSLRGNAVGTIAVKNAEGGSTGIARYINAAWCFVLFFIFLGTLEYLGMLIGGICFVFLLLTAMGERSPRNLLIHAAVATIAVGVMWSIFTYSLRVILPSGSLFSFV